MPTASFRFGKGDVHELRMEFSWFGSERYYVGDALVFKHWSLMPSGDREFSANGHTIRIALQVSVRRIASQAYVDGHLKAEDFFPELNMKLQQPRKPLWVYLATWLAIALASFAATSWLSK